MAGTSSVPLESVITTSELARRPSRAPDYQAENRAMGMLIDALSRTSKTANADELLQRLVETAYVLCRAHSAGVSILEKTEDGDVFRWPAAAGLWKRFLGDSIPREMSPCGAVLERNSPLMMSHPERHYLYHSDVPPIVEVLLIPFHSEGKPVGTIWIIAHDETRKFEAEDQRLLTNLGHFAAIAYNLLSEYQQRLARDLAATHSLQNISTQLIHEDNEDALYEKILDAAVLIMRSDFGSFQKYCPDRNQGELQLLVQRGFTPEAAKFWEWVSLDSETTCAVALRDGERVIVPDVERADFLAGTADLLMNRQMGIRSLQATPLFSRTGKLLGMLSTHWQGVYEPDEKDFRLFDVLARQAADLIERKQTEEALRESEERHAFLLRLSDTLRPLTAPAQIQAAASRVLGERLGVSHAIYGEVEKEADSDYYVVRHDYCSPGEQSLVGRYRADDYGTTLFDVMRSGRTLVVGDVVNEPLLAEEERKSYPAVNVRAYVVVPLIKGGRHVAFIAALQSTPRAWTPEEVVLAEETAERTWSAVERASAGNAFRESEARLKLALDASRMGTFVWHVEDGRSEPDARVLELFGVPSNTTLNLSDALNTKIHKEDRRRHADAVRRASDPGESGLLREDIRVVHPDGSTHWLAITGQMVFEGQPRRAVRLTGMVADITERKRIEEVLREREERLKDADRRKDEFIAVLGHELRNPLAPIRTGLELIRLSGDSADSVQRVRTMMERQVSHMVRLIDDLLDVSRITRGKIRLQRQPALLTALVNTAVEANRAALHAGQIELTVDMPEAPVVLDVDPTRFVQVLSNLLHNAVKFTGIKGRVQIAAELKPAAGGMNPMLRLTVTDSGVGISREMLPRVFDLFTQADASAEIPKSGLGIGLALARRLLEMHDGSIEAASDGPGKGSTFTIRLPLPMNGSEVTSAQSVRPTPEIRRRVVVIDDNKDSADAMGMLVSVLGGESRVAYDGESGLHHVLEFRPDIVLLDIGMPGIDGYETCRRIRKALGSDIVIIALTGWGQEHDKLAATRAGFTAHLTKPADLATLEGLLADSKRSGA